MPSSNDQQAVTKQHLFRKNKKTDKMTERKLRNMLKQANAVSLQLHTTIFSWCERKEKFVRRETCSVCTCATCKRLRQQFTTLFNIIHIAHTETHILSKHEISCQCVCSIVYHVKLEINAFCLWDNLSSLVRFGLFVMLIRMYFRMVGINAWKMRKKIGLPSNLEK